MWHTFIYLFDNFNSYLSRPLAAGLVLNNVKPSQLYLKLKMIFFCLMVK